MPDIVKVTEVGDLTEFLGSKNLLEIVIRNRNGRIKEIQKAALNNFKQDEVKEKLEDAIAILNKNNAIGEQTLQGLGKIQGLSIFNLVLSGVNLCATCAGFVIMHMELQGISNQVEDLVAQNNKIADRAKDFELRGVLAEHQDMLDCRKKQKPYSEEQMRMLVDHEVNVLEMLSDTFLGDITENKKELVFTVLSLATMLATSIRFFDEIYYYNNKENIVGGSNWHGSHPTWMHALERLLQDDFIKKVQDLGYFDMKLDALETDNFYIGFRDQIMNMKIDIEENQRLIEGLESAEVFSAVEKMTVEDVRKTVEAAFNEAGVTPEVRESILNYAVA